jgi:heme/copper-type cytochrome/quinol oxidase subunit 2
MKRLAVFLILITISWPAFAANRPSLCDGMAGDSRARCEAALELLVRSGPDSSGAVHAVVSAGKWVFRYQNADVEPRCAIYIDHLILASNRQTRLIYTSDDQMIDLDIADLGIRKTAFPGRVSEVTINGMQFAAQANADLPADVRGAGKTGIRVDVLQPSAYSAWEKGFTQGCGS